MSDQTLDEMTVEIIEDYIENERIKKIQQKILSNQDKIKIKIDEYFKNGHDYEVRNLQAAIHNASESVDSLTEWQTFNLDWCYEIMDLGK